MTSTHAVPVQIEDDETPLAMAIMTRTDDGDLAITLYDFVSVDAKLTAEGKIRLLREAADTLELNETFNLPSPPQDE